MAITKKRMAVRELDKQLLGDDEGITFPFGNGWATYTPQDSVRGTEIEA
jgi:hypothetical protein